MNRQPWMILTLCGCAILVAIGGGVAFVLERPTRLTVAVSDADPEDAALIEATAKLVHSGKRAIRLKTVHVADAAAAATAVDEHTADLAVVRSDVAMPRTGKTVVILHRDAAILMTPNASQIHALTDLPDHVVGIVRGGVGNRKLLETALGQYDIDPARVKTEDLAPGDVAAALSGQRIDAVLALGVVSSEALHDLVKSVGDAPNFIPISEAPAIAQRLSGYEATEVLKGSFGGLTPQPAEDYPTLTVTHRLVADENAAQGAVADLTRFMLGERSQIAAEVPLARRIEAPPTDKGAANPVHAGAAAYIDDEEETFFEKYSDMIYIGAMLTGVLASGATAVWSRINVQKSRQLDGSITRLLAMLAAVRSAASLTLLDSLQSEADGIMAAAIDSGAAGDERRFAAFGLALSQFHAAVGDRRQGLIQTRDAPAGDPINTSNFSRSLAGE